MSRKHILTLVLALVALVSEVAFAAGSPANVQNVQAELMGASLKVTWAPVEGAEFYRVYFSRQSILENEGNYDDYERTAGSDSEYTFVKLPLKSEKIFIGVLAVNAEGAESEGFETETSVEVAPDQGGISTEEVKEPEVPAPDNVMPEGEDPSTTAQPMEVTSVEAVSATGVLVTFSKNVKEDMELRTELFILTDSGGNTLAMTEVIRDGATLLLKTDRQEPGREYTFGLLGNITADDGTNVTPSAPQTTFTGFGEVQQPAGGTQPPTPYGKPPSSTPPVYGKPPSSGGMQSSPAPYGRPPVGQLFDTASLNLSATPKQDGTYDVIAQWVPASGAAGYGIYTSVNGAGYLPSGQAAANQTSVLYRNVKPGAFSLRITARNAGGQESRGVERSLNLPSTGLGLLGLMAAAGAGAGMKLRKKKKAV
jgi:hypothetical protein